MWRRGSHLLFEADQRDAQKTRLQAMEDSVSTELRHDPRIDIGDISTANGTLSFMVRDPTQIDAAVDRMRNLTKPLALTGNRDWDVTVVDSTRIVLTPTPTGTAQALKDAMTVARDVYALLPPGAGHPGRPECGMLHFRCAR